MTHMPSIPIAPDTVVFVGPGLVAFEQMAAVLQRRGVRTHWIGYPFSLFRRMRSRLFTPVSTASGPEELARQLRQLDPTRLIDVVASEFVLRDVISACRAAGMPEVLAAELERRDQWLDKQFTMRRLREAGVDVPRESSVPDDPEAAVRELGLPLVVKGRVGNGGVAVKKCDTLPEVAAAMADLARHGGAYAEEFLAGTDGLCYAAAYDARGTVVLDGGYQGVRSAASQAELGELGPLDELVTVDDADLLDAGRRVVAATGGVGVLNLDAIRTPEGRLVVVDVNQRPWGAMVALRTTGADFVAAWLAVQRGEPFPRQQVPAGHRVKVFSTTSINRGFSHPVDGLRDFLATSRRYVPWTGRRYVLAEWVRATLVVGRRWLRKLAG